MRRFLALARSAALEALAEPLSAVLLLVALMTVHLAPVFHFHAFGEPGRLARECGFSALLMFGLVFATASAVRAIGGEIASGTAAVALARPVPRPLFFCAKICGVGAAYALFLFAVAGATVLATFSSAVGAEAAERTGASRLWLPGLAGGACLTLGAFALAALANRFLRTRFCVWACLLLAAAQPVAVCAAAACGDAGFVAALSGMPWAIVPAQVVLAVGCGVFIVFAGALAVRLKPAPTAALVVGAVCSSFVWPIRAAFPEIGRFWLVDALADGGSPAWADVLPAVGGAVALTAFWLIVGSALLQGRELP